MRAADTVTEVADLVLKDLGSSVRITENRWGGHDVRGTAGGVTRTVRTSVEDETLHVFVFNAAMLLESDARFNHMPAAVVAEVVCAHLR